MADNKENDKDLLTQNDAQASGYLTPFRDMERIMDRFFADPFGSLMAGMPVISRRTSGDIEEVDGGYLFSAEIPGIPAKDIDIQVSGNLLTIKAQRNEEEDNNQRGFRRQYRSFYQSYALPSTIDPEKIEAHCDNGVLEIFLPKTQAAQAKRIEIQSGKSGARQQIASNVNESASTEKKH